MPWRSQSGPTRSQNHGSERSLEPAVPDPFRTVRALTQSGALSIESVSYWHEHDGYPRDRSLLTSERHQNVKYAIRKLSTGVRICLAG